MDALEELRRNREARVNNIQKGFASDEMDIQKAQVGERRNFQGKDYVWTEFAPGKFGWRRPKDGQAATKQNTPQPSKSAPQQNQEPDFTPKSPQEISRLNIQSNGKDFEDAYRILGADIVKEKYKTQASIQKYIQNHRWEGVDTQAEMEFDLGFKEAGAHIARGHKPLSKTAQIAAMKKYYEDKAARAKEAYQEKKNADYWAGAGAKRKADIMKRRDELKEQITRSIEGAKQKIQSLVATSVPDGPSKTKMIPTEVSFAVNYDEERITIQEMTDTGNRFNDGIEITITHGDLWTKPGDKGYDETGSAEINMSSMRTKESESVDWEHERNKMLLANTAMSQISNIKKSLVGYVSEIREARAEMGKLSEELKQNH